MTSVEDLIGKFLRSPIRNPGLVLGDHGTQTDSIEARFSADLLAHFSPPPNETVQAFIQRRLGHIVINRTNHEILRSSYVYARSDQSGQVANNSDQSEKRFVESLIEIAVREREFRVGNSALDQSGAALSSAGRRTTVLHGSRGAGKTFFLNHILAKFSDHFDQKKVVWVRLNMVAEFPGTFEERLLAQVAKILLRYYDPASREYHQRPVPLALESPLSNFLRTAPANQRLRDELSRTLLDMFNTFRRMDRDVPLTPALVPRVLGHEIFSLAQEAGYSFIIVVDGLDRLEASAMQRKRFKELYSEVTRYARNEARLGIALLVVTRTNTLHTESDETGAPSPFWSTLPQRWELEAAPIEEILNYRSQALTKEIQAKLAARQATSSEDWGLHLQEFFVFLERGRDHSVPYQELLASFGENRRAQMQVVQLAYHDFLRKRHMSNYLLTESIIKAGQVFPPRPYRYHENHHAGMTRVVGNDTVFDNHLLPSIFWFPYLQRTKRGEMNVQETERLLLPLRLLQLIGAHDRRRKGNPGIDPLLETELERLCSVLFGYSPETVRMVIEECVEFEFVQMWSPMFPAPTSYGGLELRLLPKAQYILRRFLFDPVYLGLWSMRIPIAETAAQGDDPFFRPASLDMPEHPPFRRSWKSGDSLAEWIGAKVSNSLNLFRLVAALNSNQLTRASKTAPRLEARLRSTFEHAVRSSDEIPAMFDFVHQMESSLRMALPAMISSFSSPDIVHLRLDSTWKRWQDA